MRYIQLERRGQSIITIEEYLKEMQPSTYRMLMLLKLYLPLEKAARKSLEKIRDRVRDVTEKILTAAYISGKDKQYAAIMQERPKPGRGGLLPGEGEEILYD